MAIGIFCVGLCFTSQFNMATEISRLVILSANKIHVAHPGSTVDYVIWRWRQEANQASGIMLPWACYNKIQHQDG